MKKKRIAVISKRRRILDFFRLEAESCLCSVTVGDKIPSDTSEYDVLIVDDDGGYVFTEIPEETYRIIPDGKELSERCFYWPVEIKRVREILENYSYERSEKNSVSDNAVLYLPDGEDNAVIYKNQKILLTESEQMVLSRLIEADGAPVGREELLKLFETQDGNIADVYICHLRRKLELPLGKRLIFTERGKGYRTVLTVVKK